MKDLQTLKAVLDGGGVVTHNGEIISSHARLEEVHANYREPDDATSSPGDVKALNRALTRAQKDLEAETKRADSAEKDAKAATELAEEAEQALTPFVTRNEQQANLIAALAGKQEDLERLGPDGIRAVAQFEQAVFDKKADDTTVITAILKGREDRAAAAQNEGN